MIFKSLGLSSASTALFAQGVYGIVKFVSCLIFILFLADSLGRRISFVWTGFVQAFCMFFVGFVRLELPQTASSSSTPLTPAQYVRFGPTIEEGQQPPPAGIAALAMIYIFAVAFNMGWGPVCT